MPQPETLPRRVPNVVLVTGVSRQLGGRIATRLATDERIERVVGVDVVPPGPGFADGPGRVEFVRADIRSPLIAKVIATAGVDTVVHVGMQVSPGAAGGRASMKELNVIGTMQLLAACQKAPSVRKLVVRSSTAVYGCSPRDPAVFTEETEPKSTPSSGYAKDALEIEGYVRAFSRRRPDTTVTVLRMANLLGPRVDTPLARYFTLPLVPTVLGFDPRLQFLHLEDALDVLHQAALEDHHGIVNVAGPGVLLLSQAIRRSGRVPAPIPALAVPWVSLLLSSAGGIDFSPEQARLLRYGRVVDIEKVRREFGFTPRYSTAETFDDFVRGGNLASLLNPANVRAVEQALLQRFVALRRQDSARSGDVGGEWS